ncbi:amino acid permease [Acetonema longum]|nr:amino acid permease [Acetonema longum]
MGVSSQAEIVSPSFVPKKKSAAERAGMTKEEWRNAIRFDGMDWGWIIMSIGMAIGAGIVLLPVQVGLVGIWVFVVSAVIGYPVMYMFQRLFINTLAASPRCEDYPSTISGYLGKNWGFFLGILYFLMLIAAVFVYSTAITNDSASYLHSFGLTEKVWSQNPFYGLAVVCLLVAIASRGEKLLFKISTGMVLTKLIIVACLGLVMVQHWNIANIGAFPSFGYLIKEAIVMLPFTIYSILFVQSLSPMVISYRAHNKSIEVARFKAMRAMNIAFGVLFVTVFFYAMSFNLAMGHDQAVSAYQQNISALTIAAQGMSGNAVKLFSLILNIFAVMTAFFGVFLGFREACQGIAMNILHRIMPDEKINKSFVEYGILIFTVLMAWGAILLNFPLLKISLASASLIGFIGCLIPAYLVYKVPFLAQYRSINALLIVLAGVLLIVAPFVSML